MNSYRLLLTLLVTGALVAGLALHVRERVLYPTRTLHLEGR